MPARWWRISRAVLLVLSALVGIGAAVVMLAFPRSVPAAAEPIEATPERLARGRYLVEHVANCVDCHSQRDWGSYGGPVEAGTEGRGAPLAVLRPHVHSANITPAALGDWTDGEIARAVTSGVDRDGVALHPFMPYDTYARMEAEDVDAMVVYLRALPPIDHEVPEPREGLPIRLLGRLLPKPYVPPVPVDRDDTVAYGRYLATLAECSFCHGADFSGGRSFRVPGTDQRVATVNLTPHPSAPTGAWTRENFIGVFKAFAAETPIPVPDGQVNTVMAWSRYAGMTAADLGAIYDYLRTIEPVAPEPTDTP